MRSYLPMSSVESEDSGSDLNELEDSDVSGPAITTSTPTKSTQPDSEKQTITQVTLGESTQRRYPPTISFVQDFHAKRFSVAGKRQGFKDTRGTLFFEIQRIAEAKRPRLLFLENVKGLLSHDGGRTFATILESLEELGYWWEYQVLNSKYFGVPQNRERVFIIGHLGEGSTKPVFPITETSGSLNQWDSAEQVANALQSPGHASGNYRGMNMILDPYNADERLDGLAGAIKTNQGSNSSTGTGIMVPFIKNIPHGYNNGFEKELPSLKSNSGAQYNELLIQPVLTPDRAEKRQHGRRFKDQGEHMFTLTGQDQHGVMIANAVTDGWLMDTSHHSKPMCEYRIRRLTPVECERLQGFPDGWTEGISDTQRYKCLGNAVTVNVIKFLGDKIKECLNEA